MLTDVLKRIAGEQMGFITSADVVEIRKDLPNPDLTVLVRCGTNRFLCPLNELEHRMASVERDGDYVRDVSIPANPKPHDWIAVGYPR
jgi:hypothetical protein